jgi:hypothetical protein
LGKTPFPLPFLNIFKNGSAKIVAFVRKASSGRKLDVGGLMLDAENWT